MGLNKNIVDQMLGGGGGPIAPPQNPPLRPYQSVSLLFVITYFTYLDCLFVQIFISESYEKTEKLYKNYLHQDMTRRMAQYQ